MRTTHSTHSPRRRRVAAATAALAIALIGVSCGGDDEDAAADPTTTETASGTEAPTNTDVPDATDAPAGTDGTEAPDGTGTPDATEAPTATDEAGTSAPADGSFPVMIEHQYGETVIPEQPERVVSVGFSDQDALLALGVIPVGIRDWYGDQPNAVWPWAADKLGSATPEVLPSTALNFEQISALQPDLIVGLSSGMTQEEYDKLAEIAPTVAQSDEYIAFGVPWQEATMVIGQATGRADDAAALVGQTEALIGQTAGAHPQWKGLEAAIGFVLSDTEIGAYATGDPRAQLLSRLGFVTPPEFDELAGDAFYSSFSWEETARLDRDVLVWIASDADTMAKIEASPLRQPLTAVAEGREIFLGQLQAGAFSFSSVLSIPYALETLVPQLEAAADGDPATKVPAGE